jgi:hypothetical protein
MLLLYRAFDKSLVRYSFSTAAKHNLIKAPHPPLIGHLVPPLKTGDGSPNFGLIRTHADVLQRKRDHFLRQRDH